MTESELFGLLEQLQRGSLDAAEAVKAIREGPFRSTRLPFAELDHHRPMRHGIGEVVYGESKSATDIVAIVEKLAVDHRPVLVTRIDADKTDALRRAFAGGRVN